MKYKSCNEQKNAWIHWPYQFHQQNIEQPENSMNLHANAIQIYSTIFAYGNILAKNGHWILKITDVISLMHQFMLILTNERKKLIYNFIAYWINIKFFGMKYWHCVLLHCFFNFIYKGIFGLTVKMIQLKMSLIELKMKWSWIVCVGSLFLHEKCMWNMLIFKETYVNALSFQLKK